MRDEPFMVGAKGISSGPIRGESVGDDDVFGNGGIHMLNIAEENSST